MKAKKFYCHMALDGKDYLLPYGQNIADFQKCIQTNAAGVMIWQVLQQEKSLEELTAALAQSCQVSEENLPTLKKDIEEYTGILSDYGILEKYQKTSTVYQEHNIQIGPLYISLFVPDTLFQRYFAQFACVSNAENCHQKLQIHFYRPVLHDNGTVLVRNQDVIILDGDNKYVFLFPVYSSIHEMHVSKDGETAELYCDPARMNEAEEEIFHGIRFAFLVLAQKQGLYFIHSASLCYRGEAWLFSGSSGTGKSTHTNLWKKHFGTEVLNGDLNMVGEKNGLPVVYGQPWCGTSGICTPDAYPLGGIVFLKQSSENVCRELETHKKILDCTQRMISPSWTEKLLLQNVHFGEWLVSKTAVFHLWCTVEKEAAEIMKKRIDAWYDERQARK